MQRNPYRTFTFSEACVLGSHWPRTKLIRNWEIVFCQNLELKPIQLYLLYVIKHAKIYQIYISCTLFSLENNINVPWILGVFGIFAVCFSTFELFCSGCDTCCEILYILICGFMGLIGFAHYSYLDFQSYFTSLAGYLFFKLILSILVQTSFCS